MTAQPINSDNRTAHILENNYNPNRWNQNIADWSTWKRIDLKNQHIEFSPEDEIRGFDNKSAHTIWIPEQMVTAQQIKIIAADFAARPPRP